MNLVELNLLGCIIKMAANKSDIDEIVRATS
mgnify:CR=1 FL=1